MCILFAYVEYDPLQNKVLSASSLRDVRFVSLVIFYFLFYHYTEVFTLFYTVFIIEAMISSLSCFRWCYDTL